MTAPRLELDFVARRRRFGAAGATLLAAGVLAAGFVAYRTSLAVEAAASADERLRALGADALRAQPKPRVQPKPDARSLTAVQAGNQVQAALDSPWADLLDAIEDRPPQDVALLGIEPSATKRTVVITAEARSADAMLEHLALLQKNPRLQRITLLSHQRQTQRPGMPWRYEIQGAW